MTVDDSFSLRGMLLGCASAGTQTEGGDRGNSWYDWYQKGHIKDGADPSVATRHWEKWREDTELMASLGIQCCRLSIEWSRIEPCEGRFDMEAVEHYRRELTLLRQLGIKPMVTLWHFSNPMWFEERGAFLSADAVAVFLRYVGFAAAQLGDLAECWITLNEPNVYAMNGYFDGSWPPGERSVTKFVRVMNALIQCHIGAYELLHRLLPGARVSFALHARVFDPKDSRNPAHQAAARLAERLFQTAMTNAMLTGRASPPYRGVKPGKYYDYIAINYYTRSTCSGLADGVRENSPRNDLGWEIYPEGIVRVILDMRSRFQGEVYITENGVCDQHDSFRCRYLYDHLRELSACGVRVDRYYHWCFCDNFEWLEGVGARFGLIYTDYLTQSRQVKKSGRFYQQMIERGGVTQEMYDEFVKSEHYNLR